MMVKFAVLCDFEVGIGRTCGARSEEYGGWPSCTECGREVCPAHMVPGSCTNDERNRCTCTACKEDS